MDYLCQTTKVQAYLIHIWVIHFQGLYIDTQVKRFNLEFTGQAEVNIVEKQFCNQTNLMRVTRNLIYVQVTNRNK